MFNFLSDKISSIVNFATGRKSLDIKELDNITHQVEEALLEADVSFSIAKEVSLKLRKDLEKTDPNSNVSLEEKSKVSLYRHLTKVMGDENKPQFKLKKHSIMLMLGLQGAGKTTTIGKITTWIKQEISHNKTVLTTSLDFRRPGAVEQLRIVASQAGAHFFQPVEKNIWETISQVTKKFKNEDFDYLIIDTPGRLHVDNELMLELKEVSTCLNPTYKFLVIDSMTGQESINVAKAFEQSVEIEGAFLSKADSDVKGGIALSFFHEIGKPVLFMGTGEQNTDLERFVPERIASRIMGEGDVQTLVENIEKKISDEDKKSQEASIKRFLEGKSTLEDFALQIDMASNMGPLSKIVGYLPGARKISPEEISKGEYKMKLFKALISSMTPKERQKPEIITESRKQRIALGSGKNSKDVEQLLAEFEERKQFAKIFKSMKL